MTDCVSFSGFNWTDTVEIRIVTDPMETFLAFTLTSMSRWQTLSSVPAPRGPGMQ